MLIIVIFLLAFLASVTSGIAFHDHDIDLESSRDRMRRQNTTWKRDTEHAIYVDFFETELPFGFEAYCEVLNNSVIIEGYDPKIEDCLQLINNLVGTADFRGYWLAQDLNCISSRDSYWMTIAGWGTCNFAVSAADCRPIPIA